MIKLISRFCNLQKYNSTKYVALNLWINQKYIPIFKQKELSQEEQKQKIYLRQIGSNHALFQLLAIFGSLDLLHISAFLGIFLIYLKQRLIYLQQETKKPEYIYMDKDGKDFVIIYKQNASETQSQQENKVKRDFQIE